MVRILSNNFNKNRLDENYLNKKNKGEWEGIKFERSRDQGVSSEYNKLFKESLRFHDVRKFDVKCEWSV